MLQCETVLKVISVIEKAECGDESMAKHCPYCTETFETLEALERHFRTMHETQPFRSPKPRTAKTTPSASIAKDSLKNKP